MRPLLYIQGMHGMGDCLHQRAVLRQLMKANCVLLETSWPSMYHDLVGDNLKLVRKPSSLRTQAKNAQRESDKFSAFRHAPGMRTMRVAYGGAQVMQTPSKTILEVMCRATGTSYAEADYTLPVPGQWFHDLQKLIPPEKLITGKPLLVYRPLVARPEWRGSMARNADPDSYTRLFQAIRDSFFVVSVADLEPDKEWLVGPELRADVTLHKGELTFETLAALFAVADCVYTSSGFAAILAPAVGTPCISVVGGYESIGCHDSGKRFAPYLAIGPRVECNCWTSQCRKVCDKQIDFLAATLSIREFLSQIGIQISDNATSIDEMYTPGAVKLWEQKPGSVFERQMRGR